MNNDFYTIIFFLSIEISPINGYNGSLSLVSESFNKFFNHVEQVKKFELLPDEWSVDTGELTPKMSLKRKVVMEKYRDAIERIYS